MTRYLALLRGVNVGGKNLLKMSELVAAMTEDGFVDVKSYINSGNVLFSAQPSKNLSTRVMMSIKRHSGLDVDVVVFTADEWLQIVKDAPKKWGKDPDYRHYLFVMLPSVQPKQIVEAVGPLKPDIESLAVGSNVLYQSALLKELTKAVSSRIAGNPLYKKMTIRNSNTAIKLAALLSTNEQ